MLSSQPSRAAISVLMFMVALLPGWNRPVLAQTVTPAVLVDAWMETEQDHKWASLIFKADSTFTFTQDARAGRWHLAGDTLVMTWATQGSRDTVEVRRRVKLDGQQLTLTNPKTSAADIYVRAARTPTGWMPDRPLTGRALPCEQGLIIKIFRCENIELLSYLPKDSLGQSVGTDLWGWHDSATGREFAITGGPEGGAAAFIEVTDPLRPRYLGVLPPPPAAAKSHAGLSVKVYQHYALIGYVGLDVRLQIFDLTQLRDVKRPREFMETAHYDGPGNAHTLAVNPETGFLYANGLRECHGLHMTDVRTPTKPVSVGCAPSNSYIHDSQCVVYRGPDRRYQGREICVLYAASMIQIIDVTDKKNTKTLSTASYPNTGLVHQGWFTDDQRSIFLDDEFDEMTVGHTRTIGFDLSDLGDPVLQTEFLNEKTTDTDHNLYIRGRYMYQGNYEAGLRIIDVADPKHPKEVGYLTDISSAWGTYPFFKNDVVGVSTNIGFFLARLRKRQ